ncbi:Uncharacterised protein [Salmonella bongori]|nr:Uncharacterised protein [Salmonella bongori]
MSNLFCYFISCIEFTWGMISFLKYNKAEMHGIMG